MEFPLKSFGAFIAGFGATSLLCTWLRIYVLGWYEAKWSPAFNFSLDTIGTFALILPVAALSFAFGAYLVNVACDPWRRSLVGSVLLAVLFFGATRLALHVESDTLASALVWVTLVLGSGYVGIWARSSAKVAT